jgi:hypothetical protein
MNPGELTLLKPLSLRNLVDLPASSALLGQAMSRFLRQQRK